MQIKSPFDGRLAVSVRLVALGAWLIAALLHPGSAGAGVTCPGGDNSPAVPVPQCVTADGASATCSVGTIELWPEGFQPAPNIPALRDSTDRVGGQTVPGAQSGHELFKSVDIVTVGNVNRLYVAYNAGLSVWNIHGNPTDPARLAFRDGWMGHFLSFPPVSEQLAFIEDVAALNINSTTDLVAVSGKDPVGPTIWTFNTSNNSLIQKYQDKGTETRQVRLVQVASGTIYLITATDDGVAVYNATAAMNLGTPCLDDAGTGPCPSVYRGLIPGIQLGAYVDAIVNPANNRVYVVTSDGNFVDLEIYELADPNNPASAVRRLSAPALVDGRGPALFNYDGHFYMALEHNNQLKIYIIDECVNGTGCFLGAGSAQAAISPINLRSNPANTEFVTHSTGAGGTPFLYYGVSVGNLDGSDIDQLFDVSALRPPAPPLPQMIDVTASGGSYSDPCSPGDTVSYWSHYYPRNTHGLRSLVPRIGKMSSKDYFYRAANSILDIHILDGGSTGNPAIDVDILNPQNEYWMGDQVTFQSTGSSGCQPNGTWLWDETTPGNLTANLVSQNGSQATYTFTCNLATQRCPSAGITVSATNTDASCNNAEVDPATLTVKDPDVGIASLDSGGSTTFVECQDVPFSAVLAGRGPAFWEWRIGGETQCQGSNPSVVDLAGTTPACQWPASQGGDPNLIFADGFESGDTSRWSGVGSTESTPGKAARAPQGAAEGTGTQVTAELVLWDEFTSSTSPVDTEQLIITVDSGDPALTGSVGESVNGFTATLTAPASFTTDWLWEFEDPAGQQTCTFGQDTVSCATEQTTVNSAAHTWTGAGTYRYNVTISNCASVATATTSGDVTIESGVATNILSFNFNDGTPAACCGSPFNGFKCSRSTNIEFAVEMSENESYVFRFDWERSSSTATPSFSVQSPSGSGTSPAGNPEWHFLKSFNASGCVYPAAKASSGAFSDEEDFFFGSIELVNGTPNCTVSQNCD